jgi:hypothetical protein
MAMSIGSMVASRPFRRDFVPPTTLTDDELLGIGAPTKFLRGDREASTPTDRMPGSRVPRS